MNYWVTEYKYFRGSGRVLPIAVQTGITMTRGGEDLTPLAPALVCLLPASAPGVLASTHSLLEFGFLGSQVRAAVIAYGTPASWRRFHKAGVLYEQIQERGT